MTPDKNAPVFALGDLVAVHQGSGFSTYEVWGRITKVTAKGSITVTMPRDVTKVFRMSLGYLRGVRKPTPHELEMRAWFAKRPKSEHYSDRYGNHGPNPEVGYIELKLDLQKIEVEALDVAIGELAELRAWFARKPKP